MLTSVRAVRATPVKTLSASRRRLTSVAVNRAFQSLTARCLRVRACQGRVTAPFVLSDSREFCARVGLTSARARAATRTLQVLSLYTPSGQVVGLDAALRSCVLETWLRVNLNVRKEIS